MNSAMVQAYWNVGRLIVEHEQGGAKRAAYGETVMEDLARRLSADFGRGFTVSNLRYMRQFFLAFPIHHALRGGLESPRPNLREELSWTHYRLLLAVEDPQARQWYMREAADQNWSTRQLERQISVLYYARLLASRNKAPVRKEAADIIGRGIRGGAILLMSLGEPRHLFVSPVHQAKLGFGQGLMGSRSCTLDRLLAAAQQ